MNDERLAAGLEEIAAEVGGTLGVAARDLRSGKAVELNAAAVFPAASIIKLPMLVEVYAQAAEGRLDLQETMPLREEEKAPGSGVLKELHPGLRFTLEDLAKLMIVISDNTASNMIIDRITPAAVNARLQSLGLTRSRLERRFFDYEARNGGLDNWACPAEFAELLARMERRELATPAACEAMLDILRRQQVSSKIPRLLPPGTPVAHKTGTISDASHDAGIIYSPAGPLVLAVMTRDLPEATAEGAIRHAARLVYEYWGREG